MLDIKTIRSQTEDVKRAVQVKGCDVDIDRILALDDRRRQLTHDSEQLRARRNELSRQIPKLSNEERGSVIAEVKQIKVEMSEMEGELGEVRTEYDALMLDVPQIPHPDAPVGMAEEDNVVLRHWGQPRKFDFEPLSHEELGERLALIDKARAVKFAGGRSYILRGAGALLELAVMRLALDIVLERGFTPILGPLMVNEVALMGTGFFPHGKEDVYHLAKDDKWLIGTSEVHLVAIQ